METPSTDELTDSGAEPVESIDAGADPIAVRSTGEFDAAGQRPWMPIEPASLEESGITFNDVEPLVMKFMLASGSASGRRIATQVRLPFQIIRVVLQQLKDKLLLAYRGAAPMSDYEYELTDTGVRRARAQSEQCSYFGSAPVTMDDYIASVTAQSVRRVRLKITDLCRAFDDLTLPASVISQIGQAVNAGQSLFLFGDPGNGKTSIAERVIRAVRSDMWIPRTIKLAGEVMRLYDPSNHDEAPFEDQSTLLTDARIDQRWVRVKRPTVVVGGELTLDHLETTFNPATGITEAPLQLKSNGGALIIDDFGRQRISTSELLNRWIVPLEKGFDYLTMPSGRQLQAPFDQLLVFATNLEPKHIVDEAFLRRIPYKVEVFDPSVEDFKLLFRRICDEMGATRDDDAIDYLIEEHYQRGQRSMRYCHPRDLLLQVKNFCEFQDRPFQLSRKAFDVAVANYFAGL